MMVFARFKINFSLFFPGSSSKLLREEKPMDTKQVYHKIFPFGEGKILSSVNSIE